jgi:hypothetical protein
VTPGRDGCVEPRPNVTAGTSLSRTTRGDDMSKDRVLEATNIAEPGGIELLTTAGLVRAAWRAGDVLSARRWSVCLTLLLLQHAEASGFAIWDRRAAVTTRRRAGHDAWTVAWRMVQGEPAVPEPKVDELLPLVALFVADETSAAA